MEKVKETFEKYFVWLLFINPVFDIIGGLFITVYESISGIKFDTIKIPLTPSLVARMLILLAFAAYIIIQKNKKEIFSFLAIGVSWFLSLLGEFLFLERFSLFSDVQYIAKFIFNIAVIIVYINVFKGPSFCREKVMKLLNRVVIWTLLLLAGTIIVCYYFRFGDPTYGDRFGFFGFKGIFYAGNDITAVFMVLLPVAIGILMYLPSKTTLASRLLAEFACAATFVSLLIISTKTSFISVIASVIVLLAFGVISVLKKGRFELKRVLAVILLIILLFGSFLATAALAGHTNLIEEISNSFRHNQQVGEDTGDVSYVVLSGRQDKLKAGLIEYKDGGVYSWLFGTGRGRQYQVTPEATEAVPEPESYWQTRSIIEMDVFEILCYYGVLGLVTMLWIYVKYGMEFLRASFKKINMMGLCLIVALGLSAGYMILAGHILFSVTSGFYFSLMLVYGKVFYAEKTEDMRSL